MESSDPEEKRALWTDEYLRYFKGPDDPDYVVIRIRPDVVEYMGQGSLKPSVWKP